MEYTVTWILKFQNLQKAFNDLKRAAKHFDSELYATYKEQYYEEDATIESLLKEDSDALQLTPQKRQHLECILNDVKEMQDKRVALVHYFEIVYELIIKIWRLPFEEKYDLSARSGTREVLEEEKRYAS